MKSLTLISLKTLMLILAFSKTAPVLLNSFSIKINHAQYWTMDPDSGQVVVSGSKGTEDLVTMNWKTPYPVFSRRPNSPGDVIATLLPSKSPHMVLICSQGVHRVTKTNVEGGFTSLLNGPNTGARASSLVFGTNMFVFVSRVVQSKFYLCDHVEMKIVKAHDTLRDEGESETRILVKSLILPVFLFGGEAQALAVIDYTTGNHFGQSLLVTAEATNGYVQWICNGRKKNTVIFVTNNYIAEGDPLEKIFTKEPYQPSNTEGWNYKVELIGGSDWVLVISLTSQRLTCFNIDTGTIADGWGSIGTGGNGSNFGYHPGYNRVGVTNWSNFRIYRPDPNAVTCATQNCVTCNFASDLCTECATGFVRKGGACVERCGEELYYNDLLKLCELDPCYSTTFFDGVRCIGCAADYFYNEMEKKCESCLKLFGQNCSRCKFGECLQCSNNFTLRESKQECYCADQKCCGINQMFSQETGCTTCLPDHTLQGNTCVCAQKSCCPKGYFFKDERCQKAEESPEGYGLDPNDTKEIKKCEDLACKSCKENFKICKDKKSNLLKFLQSISGVLFEAEGYKNFFQEATASVLMVANWDDGGRAAASAQKLNLVGKLKYINIPLGKDVDTFKPKVKEKNKAHIIKLSKSYGNKLTTLGVGFFPKIGFGIKLFLYYASWFFKSFLFIYIYKKGESSISIFLAKLIHWGKKIHFAIYNSVLVDICFFHTRVMVNMNFRTQHKYIYKGYYIFSCIGFLLIVYDTIKILKVAMTPSLLVAANILQKKKLIMKNNKIKDEQEDSKEEIYYEQNLVKKIEKRENIILRIDKRKTLNIIENTDVFLAKNITFENKPKADSSQKSIYPRIYRFLHFFRMGFYLVSIVALQQLPIFNILILLKLELFMLMVLALNQFESGNFRLLYVIFQIINHLCMILSLTSILYIAVSESVTKTKLNVIFMLLLVTALFENLFMIINLLKTIIGNLIIITCKKKNNDIENIIDDERDILKKLEQRQIYILESDIFSESNQNLRKNHLRKNKAKMSKKSISKPESELDSEKNHELLEENNINIKKSKKSKRKTQKKRGRSKNLASKELDDIEEDHPKIFSGRMSRFISNDCGRSRCNFFLIKQKKMGKLKKQLRICQAN